MTRPASSRWRVAGVDRGFTIAELVLVLGVFSGLLLTVIISLNGIEGESDVRECRSELRTIKAATERFKAEIGFWPPTETPMVEGEFLGSDETPNYTVVTEDQEAGPSYEPVGSRCS